MWLFLAFNGGKEKTTKKTNMIKCISFLYVFVALKIIFNAFSLNSFIKTIFKYY